MKININGITREMTLDEEAEYMKMLADTPTSEPSPDERLAKLEEENANLKEALEMLLLGVVDDG